MGKLKTGSKSITCNNPLAVSTVNVTRKQLVDSHKADTQLQRQTREDVLRNAVTMAREMSSGLTNNLGATDMIRTQFLRFLLDGPRDIDTECGYPSWLTPDHYRAMYDREGIAKRVVECEPEESWAMDPEIYDDENPEVETEFEEAWETLATEKQLYYQLNRIDVLSGIGQFGILLIGIDDNADLREPIAGVNDDGTVDEGLEYKLLYLRPFSEEVVFVKLRETDVNSPRYGQPKVYTIQFRDFPNWGVQAGEIVARDVHWSRVHHVADNKKMSEIYGVPRMQPVWNRLYDLRKVCAAAGEAFWKGAFPGITFEINPEVADQGVEIDKDSIREEFEKFSNGMQRYMATTGVTTKTIPPMVENPQPTVDMIMKQIAIAKGIPFRVLFGSEEAKLASDQDSRAWNKRVAKRQQKYLTPMLVRPFIQRLVDLGVLPKPKGPVCVDWPDLNAPRDLDKAQVALVQTQAITAYTTGGAPQLVPPQMYLTKVLGFTIDEADEAMEAAQDFNGDMGGMGTDDVDDDEELDKKAGIKPNESEDADGNQGQGSLGGPKKPDQGNVLDQKNLSGDTTIGKGKKAGKRVDATIVSMPALNKALKGVLRRKSPTLNDGKRNKGAKSGR